MMLVEEAAPVAEELPVAGLREHLRLGSGFQIGADAAEDAALAGFLRAAMAAIEARTGKVLLERVFRLRLSEWRDPQCQPLPLAPVIAIEQVGIEDGTGHLSELARTAYRLRPDLQRPFIEPAGHALPNVPRDAQVVIRFRAGFGPFWRDVPADLAQAVIMLAARYYEDRGATEKHAVLPFGVSALIERWRSVRVLGGRGGRA